MLKKMVLAAIFVVISVSTGAQQLGIVHHELTVSLSPSDHSIKVIDRLNLNQVVATDNRGGFASGSYAFVLHAGLKPKVLTEGWILERVEGELPAVFFGINATTQTLDANVPLEGFRLTPPKGGEVVEIAYGGVIHHPIATQGEEYQRSFSETPGLIGEEGVFLSGTSFWAPAFDELLMSFDLTVQGLVPPWDVVSQGRRSEHKISADGKRTTTWVFEHPTEEIYLVAGPWHEYSDAAGKVDVFAFLRQEDGGLAGRYLDATKRYLRLYEEMLPAFPFDSFALVENFWETGYGMPGFTLLGPQVIRFPWILTSSYPHELLHNWWGNSVYVDFDGGNWCEGLTAYMADHLLSEQRDEATTYRRSTLKKYTDFVSEGNDFPLREFSSRRSAASEAVGYGKSLMLFHMIRRAVGDEAFLQAMAAFYEKHRFERASFSDLAASFTETTGRQWRPFLDVWTRRTGAAEIEITDTAVEEFAEGGWRLSVGLRQAQEDEPFPLRLPIAITLEGRQEALWVEYDFDERMLKAEIECPSRPLRIDVDPAFDVMRRLDPMEVPPAMSTLLGANDSLFVLPADAAGDEIEAWMELATEWAKPGAPKFAFDRDLGEAPDKMAWILGWQNRFVTDVAGRLETDGVKISETQITLDGDTLPRADHSLVLIARGIQDETTAIGWIAADPVAAIAGLKRKLPHYSRYSFLAFRGSEPTNVSKGMWQPLTSAMVRSLTDGEMAPLVLAERRPLADLPPAFSASSLLSSASVLADPAFEGRGLGTEGLRHATDWVEAEFRKLGLEGFKDDSFRQSWTFTGGDPEREMELTNLVGSIPGTDETLKHHPVLILAHIDHLGRGWPDVRAGNDGMVHPGADDNASGVAVLIELARAFAQEGRRPRPIVFAVVTGEEAGLVGSRYLLKSMDAAGLPFACLNFDTVGRLGDGKLLVLNAETAREWRFIFMGVGYTTGAPIGIVAEPLDASDQLACIEQGVPAVQLFGGPNEGYHRPSDTLDKLDGDGMVVITEAAHETIAYLAERIAPLTVMIADATTESHGVSGHPGGGEGERRASLGTMPDFAYSGPGVRIQQVMEGSAAEKVAIVVGDIILEIDGNEIVNLRGFSEVLKSHAPGDEVAVTILRGEEKLKIRAVLGAR